MLETVRQIIAEVNALDAETKSAVQTALIMHGVGSVVYYTVTGLVVWALGRRIIQSVFAGIREARRDRE